MLNIHQSKNILEVGCGAGHLLLYTLQRKRLDAQYVAIDISSEMILQAEARLLNSFNRF
jgi:ubiquinone/menaquinone biosynthesis C-methylase UbiE